MNLYAGPLGVYIKWVKITLGTALDASGLLQEISGQFSNPALLLDDRGWVFFRCRALFYPDLMSLNGQKEELLSHILLYGEFKNVKAALS